MPDIAGQDGVCLPAAWKFFAKKVRYMTNQYAQPAVPGAPVLENEFNVSVPMAGAPSNPQAAALNNSQIVTVWEVSGAPGGATPAKVYAQINGEGGAAAGGIVEIASAYDVAALAPQVTVLRDGSYVVAYSTFSPVSNMESVAFRVVKDGVVGEERFVDQGGAQAGHAITTLANGDFVIGWTENGAIMTQTFNGVTVNGMAPGELNFSASSLGNTGAATSISLTHLTDDDFALAYVDVASKNVFVAKSENLHTIPGSESGFGDPDPVSTGVVITRVFDDGAVRPQAAGMATTDIATLKDGRVVVAWDSWRDHGQNSTGANIVFRIFNTDTNEFDIFTARDGGESGSLNQSNATVVALSGGGFVIAWENGASGDAADITGRRFNSNGEDAGFNWYAPFPVNQDSAGVQSSPALVAFGDNTFGAVWLDTPAGGFGAHIEGRVSVVVPLAAPDLDLQSDNGAHGDDNVTSAYQLKFTGAIAPENEAKSITVFVDMNGNGQLDHDDLATNVAPWGNSYEAQLTTPRNIEGTYSVYAVAHDDNGNPVSRSDALQLTIDTKAPTNTVADVWFGDRNSPFKLVTTSNATVLHGELAQPLAAGEIVQYYNENMGWTDLPVTPGQTLWEAPVTLSYYSDQVRVRIIDAAHNEGAEGAFTFKYDIQGPRAFMAGDPFIQIPAGDTFVIDIVYQEYESGLAPGTFGPQNITVTFGNTTLEVISAAVNSNANGFDHAVSYTVRAPGGSFDRTDAGEYLVSFNPDTIRDGIGNPLQDTSPFYMILSPRQVPTPSNPTLDHGSDSGIYNNDGVTNATSITVTGFSTDADGGQVTAFIDANRNGRFDAGTDRAGTGVVQNGAWSVTGLDTTGLDDGYDMFAFNTDDDSGNISTPGYVHIDRNAPGQTVAVQLSNDYYDANPFDLITRQEYQDLSGTLTMSAGDDLVEVLYDTSIGWVQANAYYGHQTWFVHGARLNESGDIQVRITDRAGNTSGVTHHSYLLDQQGGTAQVAVQDLSMPATNEHSFTITYTDAGGAGIDLASIGAFNVEVYGPGYAWMQVTSAVVVGGLPAGNQPMGPFGAGAPTAPQPGPQQVTVTYTVQAPGGTWDAPEAGVYTIYMQHNVRDLAGNEMLATQPATFNVSLPSAHVNTAPTGSVTITGTPAQGQTLTASNDLVDVDGIADGSIVYQWFADNGIIAGATGATLVLEQQHVGKWISVAASYVDVLGTFESMASNMSFLVDNVNDAPTGAVTITGVAKQGETLSVSNDLADADGILPGNMHYQWQADGADIAGAIGDTLVLGQDQVGKAITVLARYLDQHGKMETVSSAPSAGVVNVNDAPTGSVTISGIAGEGRTLTASNTLADADGIADGAIIYQWQADGVDIVGATGGSFVLGAAQIGKSITVVASWIDQAGHAESMHSSPTPSVANVNDVPTGSVTISGTVAQGATLTASNDLADADGIAAGSISYQWFADNQPIDGGTGATLVLGQQHVGKFITVVASYVDGYGEHESKASGATAVVTNVNDLPSGSVTISGTVKQGETLVASNDLADADGILPGSLHYQWQADGADIPGATGDTLVIGQAQVGKAITVVATYQDLQGAVESKASGATTSVVNVNDLPTGSVTVTGRLSEGETLTAANTLADADGIADGAITYQWQADGADIVGATSASFVLGAAQIGKSITVVASYVDQTGVAESMHSQPSAVVANANDAPTGSVSISGTVKQGETLTASNDLADADGIADGGIAYQWFADDEIIVGASGATLVLEQQQVGKAISVVASYVDGHGALESMRSGATAAVTNVNDAPTGQVSITGVAMQGQILTASNDLADADGIADGGIRYQWQADGVDLQGATGNTLVLTQAHAGKAIGVVASYLDQQGNVESVGASATASVVDVNDKPVLSVASNPAAQYVAGSASGAALFYNVALSTVEAGQSIGELTLRVKGLQDGAGETLVIGGKQVALVAGSPVELGAGKSAAVSLDDGALRLSLKNADGWSVAEAKALIESLQYKNVAATPTLGGERSFEITSVKDSGGTAHGGADTAFVSFVSTASVVAAPVVQPPVPETPPVTETSSTVDGVTLQTSQVTNTDGTVSQTVTIPVVTSSRVEETGNNAVADIPLLKNANGATILSTQVPNGLGLSISGSTAPKSAGDSLTDLIREIKAHTASGSFDQNQLTGGGSGFLGELAASTTLLVQTIVPTAAVNGVAGADKLVINGTPATAGNPLTALVIDAKSLAAGTQIALNNVDFAAIIGAVNVSGGAGSQHVWGDGASQTIFLGEDDDVLHGGAGNDYLDGGTGHDIALMAGNGRADYSFRVKDGMLTTTHLGGDDGVDTIANVETLRFASAGSDLSARGTVNRLVEAFTGQQGNFAATERWIDAHKEGASLADIADAMLGLNAGQGAMSNSAFVASLYQNVLHRTADAAGAAAWVKVLDSGTASRGDVALGFANSAEKLAMTQALDVDFNQTEVATLVRMYSTLFDRAADEGGLNFWLAHYEAGNTLSGIADFFVASAEQAGRGIASNTDFVNALYQSAFHRAADSAGRDFWVGVLDAGSVDQGDVLLAFAESAEKIALVGEITTSVLVA